MLILSSEIRGGLRKGVSLSKDSLNYLCFIPSTLSACGRRREGKAALFVRRGELILTAIRVWHFTRRRYLSIRSARAGNPGTRNPNGFDSEGNIHDLDFSLMSSCELYFRFKVSVSILGFSIIKGFAVGGGTQRITRGRRRRRLVNISFIIAAIERREREGERE